MAPDSLAVQLIAVGAAVLAAVALALVWNRVTGWLRWVARPALVALCLVTTAAGGLTWVNRQVDAYPTWSSLVGSGAADAAPAAPVAEARAAADSGQVVRFTVPGPASGLTLAMYAYLPAGYQKSPTRRYPVVETLHGYPASPVQWFTKLGITQTLDQEIAAGRMAPTVVLFPYQTPDVALDTECTNLAGGPQTETFLTEDVPAFARAHLRVRTEGSAWGLMGYSAGGYCASDLLLRHPGRYAAGASLSGYSNPGIAVGDGSEHTGYDETWRLTHLPRAAVALYLTCARSDPHALSDTRAIAKLARPPMSVTTAYVDGGGHNAQTWRAMEAPALDWLSTWLGRPTG
ncbi:alpha/beta hydrolase [Micromonospora sp. NPDC000089]|uniref:alpha/beta hydrolase n=1 Tax=unclassified Micromonospora TaxID=2617518 RepID=UPI0036BA467F